MSEFTRKKEQERQGKIKNDIHLPSFRQNPGRPRCGGASINVTNDYYEVTCAKCVRSLRMCLQIRLSQLGYLR